MLQDVPASAISKVHISVNNTAFPDEMLAHRMGLIPIFPTSEPSTIHLSKEGPCNVYSRDIESDLNIRDDVFIVTLSDGQKIDLTADVESGTGKEHARFVMAVAPSYAKRHLGVNRKECLCIGTPPGRSCVQCAGYKPDEAVLQKEFVYLFSFETTGMVTCKWLLNTSLCILRKKLLQISHLRANERL